MCSQNDVCCLLRWLTRELTTQELHAESAVSPAHLRVDPHILSLDRRGEGVGKWSVVINIPTEDLEGERGEISQNERGQCSSITLTPIYYTVF